MFRLNRERIAEQTPRPVSEVFSKTRPPTDQEIEDRFIDFLNKMGMHEPEKRRALSKLSLENKWKVICQYESQEQFKARKQAEGSIDNISE
ncbi:hypothetical protein BGX23_012257 [Mortierella sp. AD031]|nr:hypothetical protein BGX23_012257 [Mortierella sp. AD031]